LKLAAAILALFSPLAADELIVRLQDGSFVVQGWTAGPTAPPGGWASVLAVYAGTGDVPPMLGAYSVEGGRLVFRPRFPLSPGVTLRAVLRLPDGRGTSAEFSPTQRAPHPPTRVARVYPSSSVLPANQLRLYVCFSAPMRKGEAWQRIRLLDDGGVPVDLPFVEIDEELWDRDLKRLTVLFDPGRIKRGVRPLEEVGPAIHEGRRYTLVIDRSWPDAGGAPLVEEFRKDFRVVAADREPVDPDRWRLSAPRPGSREPLVVEFGEPMDHELLLRMIDVFGPGGSIAGETNVDRDETRWLFTPGQPWIAGDYRLLIDPFLEDLAGNRIGRAFDVDTSRQKPKARSAPVSLSFFVSKT
jgi:hypothetical protein